MLGAKSMTLDVYTLIMKIYNDDVVLKSNNLRNHLVELDQALKYIRLHNSNIDIAKCVFEVSTWNFIDFLAHKMVYGVDPQIAFD